MTSNENQEKAETEQMLEEIVEEQQKEFDNADGAVFLGDETPHYVIGDFIIGHMPIKYYHGTFYIYIEGVYVPGDKILEKKIIDLNKSLKKSQRKEIMNYIAIQTETEQQDVNTNLINFKNGLFNLTSKELLPHNSTAFTVNQIHANYDENVAVNKYIEKFLDDITCNKPERKQAILEMTGYCMTASVWIGKAGVFYGPSAENGKSVLIRLITNLIGRENTANIALHKLQERFYTANIADKLLNTASELPKTDLKSVDMFKNVVTGDEITGEQKYKTPFSFKPYAKHIFATNSLPVVLDNNDGYYRRLNILLFERKFTVAEQNQFMEEKLFTQEALDYFAYISLQAYLKLLEEGRRDFANYEESNQLIASYKADNNSTLSFLASEVSEKIFENNKRIKKTELYQIYKNWCEDNNYIADKSKNFHKKVAESKTLILKFYDGYECYQKRPVITAENN